MCDSALHEGEFAEDVDANKTLRLNLYDGISH